jgi:hypothetical protein
MGEKITQYNIRTEFDEEYHVKVEVYYSIMRILSSNQTAILYYMCAYKYS